MSDRSKQIGSYDREFVWHPFTQMKDYVRTDPIVIERAEGSYLIDSEGKKYIDGVSSLWVNIHGHAVPEIDGAIKRQLELVSHSTLLGITNPPAAELAKELMEICPPGLKESFLLGRRGKRRRGCAQDGVSVLVPTGESRRKRPFCALITAITATPWGPFRSGESIFSTRLSRRFSSRPTGLLPITVTGARSEKPGPDAESRVRTRWGRYSGSTTER